MDSLLAAIEKSCDELPSVSKAEIMRYEKLYEQFNAKKNNYRPIGFNTKD